MELHAQATDQHGPTWTNDIPLRDGLATVILVGYILVTITTQLGPR